MNKRADIYENCIVLLMGFAGSGKLTTAKELAKHPHFRLVDNHTWNNPIFNLIAQDGITSLPQAVWDKAGKICDAVFETMTELSPSHFSFVITQEMIQGDDYPILFYKRVCQLVDNRNAIFLPVRLECAEAELINRVQVPKRRDSFKTIDTERASFLSQNRKVFYTNHPNEITINNTDRQPREVARLIIGEISRIMQKHKSKDNNTE